MPVGELAEGHISRPLEVVNLRSPLRKLGMHSVERGTGGIELLPRVRYCGGAPPLEINGAAGEALTLTAQADKAGSQLLDSLGVRHWSRTIAAFPTESPTTLASAFGAHLKQDAPCLGVEVKRLSAEPVPLFVRNPTRPVGHVQSQPRSSADTSTLE